MNRLNSYWCTIEIDQPVVKTNDVSRSSKPTIFFTGQSVSGMQLVTITTEPVELYKILKFEGLVDSGGQAKAVIADGLVSVNGTVETQKRKKIVSGDIIEYGGETLKIRLKPQGFVS
jgi:ribosome-associated protein